MAPKGSSPQETEHRCMGVVQEALDKREAARNKPQPWIARKLAVFLTIGIIGYSWYVYVGRFCVPMIKEDAGALGSRGMGGELQQRSNTSHAHTSRTVGFLVVFCVLGLMTIWAYEKVVLTPPGFAKHHVQRTPPPPIENGVPTWWDTPSEADLAAARFQASQNPPQSPSPARPRHSRSESRHRKEGSRSERRSEKGSQNGNARARSQEENAGVTDALPPVAAVKAKATEEIIPPPSHQQPQIQPEPLPGTANVQKPMMYTRKPPETPILLPHYRYCHKDGFQKPLRAHHCRACGTCVLKYDHHCPWIGGCVGARNHRFFVIFVFWGLPFCIWVFSTLIALIARASMTQANYEIDPQHVVVMVFSGFFTIFVGALLMSHIFLISNNMTTVEHFGVQRMEEREKRVLARLHSWWQFGAKMATKREWDEEWGRIRKEGYMWWNESSRKNWEATMGDKAWMWFVPIGHSPDDGLSYVVNPRFDKEGRWLPRREWPAELR
ncbi:zf-DHHC-domain-containing protein [Daedaleopsis nitida]|nr:zf-DHHC-domain-containing protein [Daedaleopsis nitida]